MVACVVQHLEYHLCKRIKPLRAHRGEVRSSVKVDFVAPSLLESISRRDQGSVEPPIDVGGGFVDELPLLRC